MAKYKPWQLVCLLCVVVFSAVVALVCWVVVAWVDAGCSPGTFKRAAVSADSQLCSQIGRDMLQQGGSAADGAIAALLCTSVVNPQSMGLGGGSIFTIRDKTGKVKVYSSRETVPQSLKPDLLNDCPSYFTLVTGSQWIGVPGELRGYQLVHQHYGRLPWATLFEPTIRLAREGIPLPSFLGQLLAVKIISNLVTGSPLCELFCSKNNRTVLSKGDILKFPRLAETMETIAKEGADAFYTGKIGEDLIQDIKEAGGTLTMEDLRSFSVREEDAWTVPLGNTLMHFPPPPSGGALVAFILNVMKGFNLTPQSLEGKNRIHTYQRYVEAAKFANGQRDSILDPVFNNRQNASHLLDPKFADRIRKIISLNQTHGYSYYNVKPMSDNFGTTHVSVLAEDGSAVSVTSTINHMFGAAVYSRRTGIILNNELADFCSRANAVKSGEQPPSFMAPAILESDDSRDVLVIGGSGGSMITTAMALSIMNHLWLGMSLKDAIAAPIVLVDSKNDLKFEDGFDQSVIDSLGALGHSVKDWKYFFNVVNAVARQNSCITAVSDHRKMGRAAGY